MTTATYRRMVRLRFRLVFLKGLGLAPTAGLIAAMALPESER